jgi:ABC-type transport system substrate-binding protein
MKKVNHKIKAISRSLLIGIIIVIIVIAAVASYFIFMQRGQQQQPGPITVQAISVAPTSFVVLQGTSINFTVYNVQQNAVLRVYFGDGNVKNYTISTFTYTYSQSGHYLVLVEEYIGGKLVSSTASSLLPIIVEPNVPSTLSNVVSLPVISFNITKNPTAPLIKTGESLYLYGGFLQPPSGRNMTISLYKWDFGNGKTLTIPANSTNLKPITNPVNVTYTSPGLYTVKLTLTTLNTSSGATYNFTTLYTIAVSGGNVTYDLFKFKGNVPNPNVITVVENVPGGPFSFDPHIDYESVGFEVISNIIATLLIYNGSSTSSFIPFVAEQIPTVENGGIKNNYTVYTFKIRSGLYFENGDPITAYDVWYSMIRALLFVGGTPGTGTWILAQYLIPGATIGVPIVTEDNKEEAFKMIMNAVTYDNATNTVTFHLVKPTPPSLFFTAIADPLAAGILNAKWLQKVGAGITFTPDGFLKYEQYANQGNYNDQVRYDPIASGPYRIKQYVPGQYVILEPNPYFKGLPDIPKPNTTVIIQWVKDPQTAYNLFVSGQADIVTGLPTSYFPSLKQLVAQGQAAIYQFPTLSEFFFVFNLNISQDGLKKLNPSYHIPSDYFANLYVRKAFAYAFDYVNYLQNILGNAKYGFEFGKGYAGVIIPGLPYYTPPEEFTGVPTYNLTYAKQLLIQSGMYNVSVYFPIIVPAGDPVTYAAAQMWASALNQIDPNIKAEPLYMEFSTIISYMVPGQNPMPIYYLGWIADYPHPSDFVDAMYKENGTYPAPDGWYVSYLQQLGYKDQAQLYAKLNQLIVKADSETDPVKAKELYKQVTQIAINLYMYVYVVQPNAFWVVKPYMHGYKGLISYQENPMIGGAGDSLFFWWVKG